jgi:prevent-host-death family protein
MVMNVTAYELKTRCGELIDRAAAGEEIVITKRGLVKARMVPADYFDERKQAEVLSNMARIRERLAKKGKTFTREEIKAALKSGRR